MTSIESVTLDVADPAAARGFDTDAVSYRPLWKVATSAKKDTGRATRRIESSALAS